MIFKLTGYNKDDYFNHFTIDTGKSYFKFYDNEGKTISGHITEILKVIGVEESGRLELNSFILRCTCDNYETITTFYIDHVDNVSWSDEEFYEEQMFLCHAIPIPVEKFEKEFEIFLIMGELVS